MLAYIIRRILTMIPMLLAISFISFVIIQLPPGDYLNTLQAVQGASGGGMTEDQANLLRERYGLDEPLMVQYWKWISGFPKGDFGYSFEWNSQVWDLIDVRIGYTLLLGFCSLIIMFVLAIPIGIYSATHQYSITDHLLSALAFLGLSIPSFLLALIWLYVGAIVLGMDVMGDQSREFINQPWTFEKAWDYFLHLWPPALILALASTAQLMRIMRNGMLETMTEQYITTARAKGLKERTVVNRYAVRAAINPVVSVMAMEVPKIISSSILIGVVMSIPTTGPTFKSALLSQDMYVAGTLLLLTSVMLLVSNLIADLLLGWLDPRIVYT
ncbi:MAG TPA: ABC transporter permease [Aggregatilineaceae bacterium]|nr:ABC transporter permease [Aggregatilineaceae bacterium]